MLPDAQRLKANIDFRKVYSRGKSHVCPIAVLYVMRRTGERTADAPGRRIGFVVSKKQGGAVVRNRIKRRLREAIRQLLPALRDEALDIVLVGRSAAGKASWSEIENAVEDLLRRGNLFRDRIELDVLGRSHADNE